MRNWFKTIMSVFFIITLLFLAVALAVPPRPRLCGTCHEINPYYKSWQKSIHAQVGITCSQCHVKPGLWPAVKFRLNFFPGLVGFFTGLKIRTYGVDKAETAMCRRCHSLNRTQSTSGDLKINHRKHIEKAGLGCQKCHSGVVHAKVGRLGNLNPTRKSCISCHKKEMERCGFCHVSIRRKPPSFRHSMLRPLALPSLRA